MTDRRPVRGYRFHPARAKVARAERGLSVGQLATLAGTSYTATSRALNGHPVGLETLRKLSAALEKTPPLEGIAGLLEVAS
jgi:transcriptional regulator with XRE-family HTH domain